MILFDLPVCCQNLVQRATQANIHCVNKSVELICMKDTACVWNVNYETRYISITVGKEKKNQMSRHLLKKISPMDFPHNFNYFLSLIKRDAKEHEIHMQISHGVTWFRSSPLLHNRPYTILHSKTRFSFFIVGCSFYWVWIKIYNEVMHKFENRADLYPQKLYNNYNNRSLLPEGLQFYYIFFFFHQ